MRHRGPRQAWAVARQIDPTPSAQTNSGGLNLIAVRLSVGPMFWRVRIALLVLEGTELTADKYFA